MSVPSLEWSLSDGATVGLIIGVIIGVLLGCALLIWYDRKRMK